MSKRKTGFPSKDRTHLKGVDFAKLHPVILPLSLFGTFMMINGDDLDKIAIGRDGVYYTRRQIRDEVLEMARALSSLGLGPADTLSIATPNLIEGVVLTLAANAIGIKVAYHDYDPEGYNQLCDELTTHRSTAIVVYDQDDQFAKRLTRAVSSLRAVINITSEEVRGGYVQATELPTRAVATQSWVETVSQSVSISTVTRSFSLVKIEKTCRSITYYGMKVIASFNREPIERKMSRHALSFRGTLFLQTSGSTSGRPKYPIFSNYSVFAALMYAANSTGTERHDSRLDKVLCVLPYRLPYGWMTIFVNLLGGNRVELATGATPEDIGRYYELEPSYIYGTPQIFSDFMAETPKDADLSFLVAFFCSGFAISEAKIREGRRFLEMHNSQAEIRVNYGIGEMMCVGTASDEIECILGSSGKFYLGPDWVIVDEQLREVKYGEMGEILVRSKSAFLGYFNDPEATKRAFVMFRGRRYYRTEDYAVLDANGYVFYRGRKKRFYQPQGATDKVNCDTIEMALAGLEMVESNAVVVCSLDGRSETSQAFVVLKDGFKASDEMERQIYDQLKKVLKTFQLPGKIVFVDEVPLMDSGKIDYAFLESQCPQL